MEPTPKRHRTMTSNFDLLEAADAEHWGPYLAGISMDYSLVADSRVGNSEWVASTAQDQSQYITQRHSQGKSSSALWYHVEAILEPETLPSPLADSDSASISSKQISSKGSCELTALQQKIDEKNRKGRERSLRTRLRNIEKTQTLQKNTRQLEEQNAFIRQALQDARTNQENFGWHDTVAQQLSKIALQTETLPNAGREKAINFLKGFCSSAQVQTQVQTQVQIQVQSAAPDVDTVLSQEPRTNLEGRDPASFQSPQKSYVSSHEKGGHCLLPGGLEILHYDPFAPEHI